MTTTTAAYDNTLYIDSDDEVYSLSLRVTWSLIRDEVQGLPLFDALSYASMVAQPGGIVTYSAAWGMGFRFEAVIKQRKKPA